MKIKSSIILSALILAAPFAVGETYLIDGSATAVGSNIKYKNMNFTVGTTAFASFDELNASSPVSSSEVYVAPGTYAGATIDTYGLKIYGANMYRDWTVTRDTESVFTGIVNVNAGGVEINGFKFSEGGRIVANAATNESPQYSLKVVYNIFSGSTFGRTEGTGLVAIGKRCNNSTANETSSQRKYGNCTISHNKFTGSSTQLCNAVSIFSMFGTTNVVDNYFYEGGDAIHVGNSQGTINIANNTFSYVGNINSANSDGQGVGAFCVYADRNGQANTTKLNIVDNMFDHCYGRASYMALLRVYQGSSGAASCVTPVGYSININRNSFKKKTSLATNANQLGENIILYSDHTTTSGINYNIADNHYDKRFYKFSRVTLKDGLGQRDWYSSSADQFTIAGKYSTMGVSVIDGNDISYHLKNFSSTEGTVIQSLDIDPVTGDIYYVQLMNSSTKSSFCSKYGLSYTNSQPLTLTRIPCTKKATKTNGTYTYSSSTQKMYLGLSGHGVKISVFRDRSGQLWIISGSKASENGTSNDTAGPDICRFKFKSGAELVVDGRANSTVGLQYYTHPKGHNNVLADVDPVNRYICYSSTVTGKRVYYIYNLDDFLDSKDTYCGKLTVALGADPITGSGVTKDTGFQFWDYQSFTFNGDYLYTLEGECKYSSDVITSGKPPIIVNTFNWRTGQNLVRKLIDYGRINDMPWGEPEGMTIRPDVFGHMQLYLAITNNGANGGNFSVFKFHVDRHVDSNGNVIGGDTAEGAKHFSTSQYSGIEMTPSLTSISLSAASVEATPSKAVKITRSSNYMFGKWTACITGEDGKVFDVVLTDHTQFSTSFKATVTFHPDGLKNSYSANLRLSSPNASDIVIPITASVAVTGPSIAVSKTALTMNTTYDSTTSSILTVTGDNLEGDINISLEGENADMFSLSTNAISKDVAEDDVEITFTPNGIGEFNALLRLQTEGGDDKTVTLKGISSDLTYFEDNVDALEEKWVYSQTKGNLADASWLSVTVPQSRDIAFNDGKLYVLNASAAANESQSVTILDAYTGAKIGNLDMTGVSGGQTYAASIKALDGVVLLSNGAPAGENLKVYAWDDDDLAPRVILEDATHGEVQVGEIMSVYGNWTAGKLMFSNGSKLVLYDVTDGKVSSTATTIDLVNASGAAYSVGNQKGSVDITLNEDGSYWVVGKGVPPTRFDSTGKYIEQVSSSVINSNANSARIFDFGERKYMAATTYLNINTSDGLTTLHDGALVLKDITDGITASTTPLTYPSAGLGETRNVQFQQAVCYEISGRKLNLWVLSCLQGIAHYSYDGDKPTAVDEISLTESSIAFDGEKITVEGAEAARISVYNVSGALVAEACGINTLSIEHLPAGVYAVSVSDVNGNVMTKKIVK